MSATLQELRPAQLRQHQNNPRANVGDVAELAASITEQGLLEPLIVAPVAESKAKFSQFVVIAGHRRLAAAKLAKLSTVPCLVREDLVDEAKQIEAMLVENLQRTDLTPIEEANAYQLLLEFDGYTQKRISQATGRTPATIKGRLKLAALPHATKAKIQSGQITLADANALTEFVNEPARYKRLEAAIGTTSWIYELQRARADRDRDRKAAKTRKDLEAAGVRVLKISPTYGDVIRLDAEADIEAHRECEGFAAYIGWDGRALYVCDKPQLHAEQEAAVGVAAAQADEDRTKLRAALENAAGARQDFMTTRIADGCDDTVVKKVLCDAIIRELDFNNDLRDVAVVHAMVNGAPFEDDVDEDDCLPALDFALRDLRLDQLAIVLDVVLHLNADHSMRSTYGWSEHAGAEVASWRRHLVDLYGYEWSQAELDAMPAPAVVDVELPEPASDGPAA